VLPRFLWQITVVGGGDSYGSPRRSFNYLERKAMLEIIWLALIGLAGVTWPTFAVLCLTTEKETYMHTMSGITIINTHAGFMVK
jgi:hypothetical protein